MCQEVYAVGDKLVRLPCGHFYHEVINCLLCRRLPTSGAGPRSLRNKFDVRICRLALFFFVVCVCWGFILLRCAKTPILGSVPSTAPGTQCFLCLSLIPSPAPPFPLRVPPLFSPPQACLLKWLKLSNTCPYCRRELPSSNEAAERARRARQAAGGPGDEPWQAFFD